MRYVYSLTAAIIAMAALMPVKVSAQAGPGALSISNYQFISEQRSTRTEWFVTYRVEIQNTGPALSGVTASVMSSTPAIRVIPGQGVLHFGPVPANGRTTSIDTLTLLVDRSAMVDLSTLVWSFVSPVANAGANQTAAVGTTVTLNGTGSSNPTGVGSLSYLWAFVSKPASSSAVINNPTNAMPTFVVDVPGDYVIALTVKNGAGQDAATTKVSTANSAPVAKAGADQTVSVGATVTLNGSGSSDVDGDPLSYFWTLVSQPAGSSAFIANFRSVTATFIADKPGIYVVQLVVNDGKLDSTASTVKITTSNTPPVANPGQTQVANIGSLVQLNGSGSTDVDADSLTYKWSLITVPTNSTANLNNANIVNPTFTADLPGTYVAQLIVNDGKVDSAPATVTISTASPQPPIANAGANQTVKTGATVTLTGSGSDPQSLPLTYSWSLTTRSNGSTAALSSTTSKNPTFVADKPGTYVAQLIVNNGYQNSQPSTVTITTSNTPPVANAGPDQSIVLGSIGQLDGSASSDADGDPLTYSWSFVSRPDGSTVALSASNSKTPTFTPDLAGTYVVQLIVNDALANSSPATVMISVGARKVSLNPNPLNLSTSAGTLVLTLGVPTGDDPLTVDLTGFDPAIVSMPTRVTIPAHSGGVNIQVSPVAVGTTNVLASAPGYQPGGASIVVTASAIAINLDAPGVGIGRSINGTLTLSTPAGAGGVVVTLSASPTGLLTINPTSITVPQGSATASFSITGVAEGNATIKASASGYQDGSASVLVASLGAIALGQNVTVGAGKTATLTVTLSSAAPSGGATVTLTSSDTNIAQVPASVFIPAGAKVPASQPVVTGVVPGQATISASATGFAGDSQVVKVDGLGIVLPSNVSVSAGSSAQFNVTLSANAPQGGVTVNLQSSDTSTLTIAPATITFAAGSTQPSTVPQITGVKGGTVTVSASANGLSTANTQVQVTSGSSDLIVPTSLTVSPGDSIAYSVSLAHAAAAPVTITLTISDSSKATLSQSSITIDAGQTQLSRGGVTVTGVANGTATITAKATGYTPASTQLTVGNTISLTPADLTISAPGADANLVITLSTPPSQLTQFVLTSSNPGIATTPAFIPMPAGSTVASFKVSGVAQGTTKITASAPGYVDGSSNVTVQAPGTVTLSAGKTNLQIGESTTLTITLSKAAPTGGASVTITPSIAKVLQITPTTLVIPQGSTTGTATIVGATVGSPSVNVTVQGYSNPAPVVINVSTVIEWVTPNVAITDIGVPTYVELRLYSTVPGGPQFSVLDGITVNLVSSRPDVATVPPTATFYWDGSTIPAIRIPVTAVAPGTTIITATGTNIAPVNMTVNVAGPLAITTASLPNGIAGSSYTFAVQSSGGKDPKTWSATGLPANLSINTSNGVISGTPTAAGDSVVTITVTDSNTPALKGTATFNLKITAAQPASISIVDGSSQSVAINTAFANPLRVVVKDSSAKPLAGIQVTFSAPGSGASGTFAGGQSVATTDASGIATSPVFTANSTAGAYSVTASTGSVSTSFSLTNLTGTPAISVVSGSGQSAPINTAFALPLKVQVKDQGNNPISNATVTFTVPGSGASAAFAGGANTAKTDASGFATSAILTANGTAGQYNVVATVGAVSATFTLTNTPGSAGSITVVAGSPQSTQVNTAFASPLKVLVKDAGGNPVSGATITFAAPLSGPGGTFAGGQNSAVTDASGTATSTVFTANSTAGVYNVVAAAGSVTTSFALTNTPGAPASIAAASGSPQSASTNSTFGAPLKAIVKDAGGNPISGVVVTFTAPGSGASGSFAGGQNTATTDASGVATSAAFTANGTPGSYNVTAAAGALSTQFALTNITGPAASVTINSGSGQTATVGAAFTQPLVVLVKDSSGNPVSGATVTFTGPASGAGVTFANGNTAVTNGSGIATSPQLNANNTAGAYSITATSGQASATATLTNVAATPATLTVIGGTPQGATILSPFGSPLQVKLTDTFGNPINGATVTFSVPGTGPSAVFAGGVNTAKTDASGVATSAILTANKTAGNYIAAATIATPGVSATFNLTNQPGPPALMTSTGGSGQSTNINTPFTSPFQVVVTDAGGNLLRGVQVMFIAPNSGPSGTFNGSPSALTDSLGSATSPGFTANGTVGSYNVTANVQGLPAVSFALINSNTSTGGAGSLAVTNATIGKDLQAPITISLNPPPGPGGVSLTITSLDSSKALVGNSGVQGSSTITAAVPQGTSSISTTVQALVGSGSTTIQVSAPGYATATSTITFAPSGLVISGPSGIGGTFNAFQGTTTPLTVFAGYLDSSGMFAASQQVRGGFVVNAPVNNAVSSVGSLSAAGVVISGGSESGNVNFVASPTNTGTTDISVSLPGFTTPTTGSKVTAIVQGSNMLPFSATIGQFLEKNVSVSLSAPAPAAAPVTITSNDPSKLKFARNPTDVGESSITVTIPPNQARTPEFYAQVFDNSGTVGYTATASSYGTVSGVVTMAPSGLAIMSPAGFGAANFTAPLGVGPATLTIYAGRLATDGSFAENQQAAGGVTLSVTVVSANTAIGTITTSPINIPAGLDSASTSFQPHAQGSTMITASSPNLASAQVGATVNSQKIPTPAPVTVGQFLQDSTGILLPSPAGASGLNVTVTSNSPSLKLTTNPNVAGASSIVITIPANQQSATLYLQSLANSGSATYTISTASFGNAVGTVQFAPSAVILFPQSVSGPLSSGSINSVAVITALLDDSNTPVSQQSLAGGAALNVAVSSGNTGVATVPTTVTIAPGSSTTTLPITLKGIGTTGVSVSQPSGWTTPNSLTTASVNVF